MILCLVVFLILFGYAHYKICYFDRDTMINGEVDETWIEEE